MKTCIECGVEKELCDFNFSKRDNRYYNKCKVCHAAHTKRNKAEKPAAFNSWVGMINRCTYPSDKSWKYYGAKGVTIHPPWRKFEVFLAEVGDRPADPEGWTSKNPYWSLDRIDPFGNYEPGNVRWATWEQQIANRRANASTRPRDTRPPKA